jgi:hypothetical protein
VIEEKPEEIIERSLLQVLRPRLNRRVQSMAVWLAYCQWCADRGLKPVSQAMFGRLARGRKARHSANARCGAILGGPQTSRRCAPGPSFPRACARARAQITGTRRPRAG